MHGFYNISSELSLRSGVLKGNNAVNSPCHIRNFVRVSFFPVAVSFEKGNTRLPKWAPRSPPGAAHYRPRATSNKAETNSRAHCARAFQVQRSQKSLASGPPPRSPPPAFNSRGTRGQATEVLGRSYVWRDGACRLAPLSKCASIFDRSAQKPEFDFVLYPFLPQ